MAQEDLRSRQLVETTCASGTARVASYARIGSPIPESVDLRGEGYVHFDADRLWLGDRLLTDRMEIRRRRRSNPVTRVLVRRLSELIEQGLHSGGLVLFEGGALRKRQKDGRWGSWAGSQASPRPPRHPLCVLTPLENADVPIIQAAEGASVRGEMAQRFAAEVEPAFFDAAVWSEINSSADARSGCALRVNLWIDSQMRIVRVAFEGARSASDSESLWCITELWDWGVAIPPEDQLGLVP